MIAPQTLLALAGAAYLFGKFVRQKSRKQVRERPADHAYRVADEVPLYASEPLAYPHPDFNAARALAQGEMLSLLHAHLRYPAAARKHGVEGTAVVLFNVETDGTLSGLRLQRDPGHGMGPAALDAVRHLAMEGKAWRPAYRDGEAVRFHYVLPVQVRPREVPVSAISPPYLS